MRNISFALTEPQILAQTKDVTRRLGWRHLKAGDQLQGCRKVMGRKPGEPLVKLAVIVVHSVTFERLDAITPHDVEREGFPGWLPHEFVKFFIKTHPVDPVTREPITPATIITRIAFRYAQTIQKTNAGEARTEAAERPASGPVEHVDDVRGEGSGGSVDGNGPKP